MALAVLDWRTAGAFFAGVFSAVDLRLDAALGGALVDYLAMASALGDALERDDGAAVFFAADFAAGLAGASGALAGSPRP